MQSRWHDKKEQAISLRREGKSIRSIEIELGIPRSTLSGWFKNVLLTDTQKEILKERWKQNFVEAQKKAANWHREQKGIRIKNIENGVGQTMEQISENDSSLLEEIALAFLYLGEGSKSKPELGLGNSDAQIIRFYVATLEKLYGILPHALNASLHLRADQDEDMLKEYWSNESGVPIDRFKYVLRDKRTIGSPTYPNYHGVCYIGGGGVEIQRRLVYLARAFCERISLQMRD